MKKSFLSTLAIAVLVFAFSFLLPSGAYAQRQSTRGPSRSSQGNERYMVIKVTDENNEQRKVQYKAISNKQFREEQKRAKETYDQKVKEWHDLKKTDHSAPKPKPIKIEKIQTDYETQKIAQEYAEQKNRELEEAETGDVGPSNHLPLPRRGR